MIALDGEQLAQAFKNILSNAVDAAPEATDITLQSARLPNGGLAMPADERRRPDRGRHAPASLRALSLHEAGKHRRWTRPRTANRRGTPGDDHDRECRRNGHYGVREPAEHPSYRDADVIMFA